MQPRLALVLALVSVVLAVAVVSVDLAYTLEVRLESRDASGTWRVLAVDPYDPGASERTIPCGGPDLRVVADNHRPISGTVDLVISYTNATGSAHTVAREHRSLAAFTAWSYDWTIPASAFQSPATSPEPTRPAKSFANAVVAVDHHQLMSCVQAEAP